MRSFARRGVLGAFGMVAAIGVAGMASVDCGSSNSPAASAGDSGSDSALGRDSGEDATQPLDSGPDAPLAPDAAGDATSPVDAGPDAPLAVDAGADATRAEDAGPPIDGGPDTAPPPPAPRPCDAQPVFVQDGGAAPTRSWCTSFAYDSLNLDCRACTDISAGFSADGGVTIVSPWAEGTIQIAGTLIVMEYPFVVALDPSGNLASVMAPPTSTDAGGFGFNASAVGASGELVLSGGGSSSETLWMNGTSGGAPAAGTFTSIPGDVLSIAPLAGGDFVVAGTFADGADFGTGPLTAAGAVDLFVARFSPAGTCRWASALGRAPLPAYTADVVADADGHVSVVTVIASADAGSPRAAAGRFDATTGAKQWVTEVGVTEPNGVALGADGDNLVVATGYSTASTVSLSGADGSVRYQGPPMGGSVNGGTLVSSIVSDGAGGMVMTGQTYGGLFGSIDVPTTQAPQCFVARTDAAGNPTWFSFCSPVTASAGAAVIVSGKELVVVGTVGLPVGPPSWPGTVGFLFAAAYALP
jgi:hypothetical protein